MLKLTFGLFHKEYFFRTQIVVGKFAADLIFTPREIFEWPMIKRLCHNEYGWMLSAFGFFYCVSVNTTPTYEQFSNSGKIPDFTELRNVTQEERAKVFAKCVSLISSEITKRASQGINETSINLTSNDVGIHKAIRELFESQGYKVKFNGSIVWVEW